MTTGNPLEESLIAARDDVLARPAFYRRLMESVLFLPGDCGREGELVEAQRGDTLNIGLIHHNGRDYHPVFSSLERLKEFRESRAVSMKGHDLFRCTPGVEFLLNPNTDCGKRLTAPELAFWLDPSARAERRMKASEALIAPPSVFPTQLAEALSVLFRARANIQSAYLMQVAFSNRNEPSHPLIGVEASGNWAKICAEVSEIAGAILPELIIDVVPVDRHDPADPISLAMLQAAPFYTRGQTTT
ncbi:MAG TPA: enhanced serine sensitivity protein SseB C-terminal domain-containing protein [Rhizomicrobium sp.]|jgi:hypothetical protein